MIEQKISRPLCHAEIGLDLSNKWECAQCGSSGEVDEKGHFIVDINGPVIQSARHNYQAANVKKTAVVVGTTFVLLAVLGLSIVLIPIFYLDIALACISGFAAMVLLGKFLPGQWVCPSCKKELNWDNRKGPVYSEKCPHCGIRIK